MSFKILGFDPFHREKYIVFSVSAADHLSVSRAEIGQF